MEWVLISYQIPRTDCDIILDTIAAEDAPPDFGIRLSKPYYRSGVALTLPVGSAIRSFEDLNRRTKVAVQTGSLAARSIDPRHVPISVFGFVARDAAAGRCTALSDRSGNRSATQRWRDRAHLSALWRYVAAATLERDEA